MTAPRISLSELERLHREDRDYGQDSVRTIVLLHAARPALPSLLEVVRAALAYEESFERDPLDCAAAGAELRRALEPFRE